MMDYSTVRKTSRTKLLSLIMAVTMFLTLGLPRKAEAVFGTGLSGFSTLEGYNVDDKSWSGDWTTGNLGTSYAEGEWFPGRLTIDNFQSNFPSFAGFPDIGITYDATYAMGGGGGTGMFIDMVKGIQIGVRDLSDLEAYPQTDGTAYPMGTELLVDAAQNHTNESAWTGFRLFNLPNTQVNRSGITGSEGQIGTVNDAERMFIITPADITAALNAMGIPLTTNRIQIYFEFHLARTSIWGDRNLQDDVYTSPPQSNWGGYIYDKNAYPNLNWDTIVAGAGPKSGSSGHFEFLGAQKSVPLPSVPETFRTITGMKFLDSNNNGLKDTGEPPLSGWVINLDSTIEGSPVTLVDTTDANGIYEFDFLTFNTELRIHEIMEPNYFQTFPNAGTQDLANGAHPYSEVEAGTGTWRWFMDNMLMPANSVTYSGMDFGNFLPAPSFTITKTGDALSKIGDDISYRVSVTNTGNVPLSLVSMVDDKFGPLAGFAPTLAIGATEYHDYTGTIPAGAADPFVNTVTASYQYLTMTAISNNASHNTNLFQPSSTITKTVDKDFAIPGETVHYIITVNNTSSADTPVLHYTLTDELLGWTGTSAKTFSLSPTGQQVYEGDYVIPLTAVKDQIITNTASFTTLFDAFPNVLTGSASVNTVVRVPGIRITKTGDGLSKIGDMTSFTFEIENTGNVPLTRVEVKDLTFNVDLTSHFPAILQPGDKASWTESFAIPQDASDPFVNTARVRYKYVSGAFEVEVSNEESHSVDLFQPSSTISKSVDKAIAIPGETIHYTIIVTNTSSETTPTLHYVLTDPLLVWIGNDARMFDLNPGQSITLQGDYVVPANAVRGSVIINTAYYTTTFTNFPNIYSGNASASTTVLYPDIKITKTGDALSKRGDETSFTFEIENTGDVPLTKVSVKDLTFNSDISSHFPATLAVGAKASWTGAFAIPMDAPDPFVNTAEVIYKYVSGSFERQVSNQESHSVNLFQPSSTITKTVDKAFAIPGETVQYTITVTNTSSEDTPVLHYTLTDVLIGWTGADDKNFDLLPGQSQVFVQNYIIPSTAELGDVITNTAAYSTTFDNFPNVLSGSASASTTVNVPGIKITKTGDAISKRGDMTSFTFEIENTGNVPLTRVEVKDLTFDADLTSHFPEILGPGEKATYTASFAIPMDAADPFVNTARVRYKYVAGEFESVVSDTDSYSLNLFQPSIMIEKSANKSISMIGDTITYTIKVTNTSSADSPDLVFSVHDDIVGDLILRPSATPDAEKLKDSLAPGAEKSYSYTFVVPNDAPSPLVNTAEVTASPVGFPNVLKDSDSASIRLFVPSLTLTKRADSETSKVGDTIRYTFVVTNTTPQAFAPNIAGTLTDPLIGVDEDFSLAPGEVFTFHKDFVVPASADPDYLTKLGWTDLVNTARVVADAVGFELITQFELEDSVTVKLVHPHIDIVKTVDPIMAHVGDTVTYTVTITNTGDVKLVNIVVSDTWKTILDADFVDSLEPGASDTFTYPRTLTAADVGILNNTASVTANPENLPNVITDSDPADLEVRQVLYHHTAWAYGDELAITFKSLNKTWNNWGWTNGPVPDGTYHWPLYIGAGLNVLEKGTIAGYVDVIKTPEAITVTYTMLPGYSLYQIHLWVGNTPLPLVQQGKKSVMTNAPGQFTYIPMVDGETTWSVTIPVGTENIDFRKDIYIAAHSTIWVPWQQMNILYNTLKY